MRYYERYQLYARCIVGWPLSRSLHTDMVPDVLEAGTVRAVENQGTDPSER